MDREININVFFFSIKAPLSDANHGLRRGIGNWALQELIAGIRYVSSHTVPDLSQEGQVVY